MITDNSTIDKDLNRRCKYFSKVCVHAIYAKSSSLLVLEWIWLKLN